jgi:predicted nucleic acid-binding protein
VRNQTDLLATQEKYPLGLEEISSILLAKEIQADEILLDDYNARKPARVEGFYVRGSVGLIEAFYTRVS